MHQQTRRLSVVDTSRAVLVTTAVHKANEVSGEAAVTLRTKRRCGGMPPASIDQIPELLQHRGEDGFAALAPRREDHHGVAQQKASISLCQQRHSGFLTSQQSRYAIGLACRASSHCDGKVRPLERPGQLWPS